jgi:signal transduction histidine kinase
MPDDIHLLLHNIGFILTTVLGWCMAALIYFKDRKPLANKLLIGGFVAATLFTLSHVLAVNVTNGALSRAILQINVSNIFTELVVIHSVLLHIGVAASLRKQLYFLYTVSISLSVFYWLFPNTFLLESVPKMYFPNYYEAGSLYILLIIWNVFLTVFFVYHVYKKYPHLDPQEKNRSKYFIAAYFAAFLFGSQAYFLVFNIPVDPLWAIMLIPSFTIPFTYAVLKYHLLDIRIVAKRAFIYAVVVGFVGIFIIFFNYLNNILIMRIPGFPVWLLPFISALLVVSIGVYIWKKFRQDEMLKYEFITVVTHKFRTPLTHIKWASENLLQPGVTPEDRVQLSYVQNANTKLVELTNLLMNVSETENTAYDYQIRKNNLASDVGDIIVALTASAEARNIKIINSVPAELFAVYDNSRIKFVIQILVENAIHYTPEGGTITISSSEDTDTVTLRIRDTGIGIPPEELEHLFSKFYRGTRARVTDTEGMGIGLFLSKTIIGRQRGTIWAESEGVGKGSTLCISLPKTIK